MDYCSNSTFKGPFRGTNQTLPSLSTLSACVSAVERERRLGRAAYRKRDGKEEEEEWDHCAHRRSHIIRLNARRRSPFTFLQPFCKIPAPGEANITEQAVSWHPEQEKDSKRSLRYLSGREVVKGFYGFVAGVKSLQWKSPLAGLQEGRFPWQTPRMAGKRCVRPAVNLRPSPVFLPRVSSRPSHRIYDGPGNRDTVS